MSIALVILYALACGNVEAIPAAAAPTPGQRLVLRDGKSLPVRWWRLEGALVLAETGAGQVVSIRAVKVDLEASARSPAAQARDAAVVAPSPAPATTTSPSGTRPTLRPGSFSIASGTAGRARPRPATGGASRLADSRRLTDALWAPKVEQVWRRLERARAAAGDARAEVERIERALHGGAGEARVRRVRELQLDSARRALASAARELGAAEEAFRERTEQARRAGASFSVYKLR